MNFYISHQQNIMMVLEGISGFIFIFLLCMKMLLTNAAEKEMAAAVDMKQKYNDLLKQTVEALASAVDAKDNYTHGHSSRVAKYAGEIARTAGMTAQECEDVYLAGLLHDVGKIGIEDALINKPGKLTAEEYSIVKQHTSLGSQILSKIVISPSLSVGVHYHHERYDGTINGPGYREIAFIRLDGEVWCENDKIINDTSVSRGSSFENWSVWKQKKQSRGQLHAVSIAYNRHSQPEG